MPETLNLQRTRGWQERLSALTLERLDQSFEWGQRDCALWAADCVLAMTGEDLAAELRGQYSTALQAARTIDEHGGLHAIVRERLGDSINPMLATVGDVGLVVHEDRKGLAVCSGAGWLAQGERGLATLPFEAALMAWRVPACA